MAAAAPPPDERVAVLIVGGGLSGLATSLFLAQRGVASLLVERRLAPAPWSGATPLPGPARLAEAVRLAEAARLATASIATASVATAASLLPTRALAPLRAAGVVLDGHVSDLPARLRERACDLGGVLRFAAEHMTFDADARGVTALVCEAATRTTRMVRARYLVAADGCDSPIRRRLGVRLSGLSSAWVAQRYLAGRVLLVGDTAHRLPGGAPGLALAEAAALARALEEALATGDAAPLTRYHEERQPLAARALARVFAQPFAAVREATASEATRPTANSRRATSPRRKAPATDAVAGARRKAPATAAARHDANPHRQAAATRRDANPRRVAP